MGNNLSYQRDKKWKSVDEAINDNVKRYWFPFGPKI